MHSHLYDGATCALQRGKRIVADGSSKHKTGNLPSLPRTKGPQRIASAIKLDKKRPPFS